MSRERKHEAKRRTCRRALWSKPSLRANTRTRPAPGSRARQVTKKARADGHVPGRHPAAGGRAHRPPSPSTDRKPSFSGPATDTRPVGVSIYKGTEQERRKPVLTVQAEVSEGQWNTGPLGEALEFGQYTAVANEPSSLENEAGVSKPVTFAVEKIPPGVKTELGGHQPHLCRPLRLCQPDRGLDQRLQHRSRPDDRLRALGRLWLRLGCARVPAGGGRVRPRIHPDLHADTRHHIPLPGGRDRRRRHRERRRHDVHDAPAAPETRNAATGGLHRARADRSQGLLRRGARPPWQHGAHRHNPQEGPLFAGDQGPRGGAATIACTTSRRRRSTARRPKPVLLASGQVTFSAAGSKTLTLHLTKAGRTQLKRSKNLKITVTCSFRAVGGRR